MADESKKRKEHPTHDDKKRSKKQWRTPKRNEDGSSRGQNLTISPGDAGIWVTCEMGREAKCVGELRDLFEEYAEKLYGDAAATEQAPEQADAQAPPQEHDNGPAQAAPAASTHDSPAPDEADDIEASINAELSSLQQPAQPSLFTHIRVDIPCVLFFRTRPPVDPNTIVHAICADAATHQHRKRTRFVKRLTPMTLVGRATESGLEDLAAKVLAPWFHGDVSEGKKFAIRPSIRYHGKELSRDSIIKLIASAVGAGHKVDLKNYDLLIIVEVYKTIVGMSVVQSDFEELKRYNLAEIHQPSRD